MFVQRFLSFLTLALRTGGFSLNAKYELLDRHLWIPIRGVEGELLSRRFGDGEDVGVLRRAVRHDRDQLHVSPHSRREDNRKLENTNAAEISLFAEGSAENHPLVEAARLFRHARILLQNHHWSWRPTWSVALSASANLQKRCRRVEIIPPRIAGHARGF